MARLDVFEKTVLGVITAFMASGVPAAYFAFGRDCSAGFFLGSLFAALSFTAIVFTVRLLLPDRNAGEKGRGGKLFVAALYVSKLALFVASFWFVARHGIGAIIAFIGGFSALLPALLFAGFFRPAPAQKGPNGVAPAEKGEENKAGTD